MPDSLTHAGIWLLRQIGAHVSPARLQKAGAHLGSLGQATLKNRRHIVATNLELCFPDWTQEQRAKLARQHFREVGKMAAETTAAWFAPDSEVDHLSVQITGLEHVHQAQGEGRGALLLSGHFTTMEICARLLGRQLPFGALYRPHDQAEMELTVARARTRYVERLIPKSAVREAIRYLRGGGALWFAPDQHYKGVNSVAAPFMGVPAQTITTPAELVRLTNAAVIGFHQYRNAKGDYHIELHAPLENFPTGDAVADATRINAVVEANVAKSPSQYLWTHRRFKGGESDPYSKS